MIDTAASIHHSVHAYGKRLVCFQVSFKSVQLTKVTAQLPHAGTQTKTIISTMVERPIGNAPKRRGTAGWRIIVIKRPGYMKYRRADINVNRMKRARFRTKKMTEIQYSQAPL
jgi:hypothetical protein